MAIEIKCPNCGETERARLRPKREGERIFISCESCGRSWERHPDACPQCASRDVGGLKIRGKLREIR